MGVIVISVCSASYDTSIFGQKDEAINDARSSPVYTHGNGNAPLPVVWLLELGWKLELSKATATVPYFSYGQKGGKCCDVINIFL